MKQRITYLQPQGTGIDPSAIHLNPDSLVFSNGHNAALEKRVTVGLSELPTELAAVLEDCHELHIRWSAPEKQELYPPLVSRTPPGLHVFFTPRESVIDHFIDLCPLLQTLFGHEIKCHSVKESFSKPSVLSERFAGSATYQYYHALPSLSTFSKRLSANFCSSDLKVRLACETEAEAIEFAASLDIDFDVISHALTVTAAWGPDAKAPANTRPGSGITSRSIVKLREDDAIEVGLLQGEKAEEVEEMSLGGYLAVLGNGEKASPTLFSFPSRHHPLLHPNTFTSSFQQPTGLHPILSLSFSTRTLVQPSQASGCALHAYLTLPSALFIDRYPFTDALFLDSHNLAALRALSGEQDLEAPDWVIKSWGSAALFELQTPAAGESGEWQVTIPTHLRYVKPETNSTSATSHATLDIPTPAVFWACHAEEGTKFPVNPFDRVNLGYDGLFGPKTMFYHMQPEEGTEMLELNVPVLDPHKAGWVPWMTGVVVLVGFGWVMWKLIGGSPAQKEEKEKKVQ